jgi:hypothetical protein
MKKIKLLMIKLQAATAFHLLFLLEMWCGRLLGPFLLNLCFYMALMHMSLHTFSVAVQ